jgi:hypothetical protein
MTQQYKLLDSSKLHRAFILSRKAQNGPNGLGLAMLILKDPELERRFTLGI